MKSIDKLIIQARAAAHIRGNELDHYDFRKLTTDELKEIVLGDQSEERFQELISKARIS